MKNKNERQKIKNEKWRTKDEKQAELGVPHSKSKLSVPNQNVFKLG